MTTDSELERKLGVVDLVRGTVKLLVDDESAVDVRWDLQDGCVLIRIQVARNDVGKVIGKQGRTVRSLRTILSAVSMKSKVRCELNIHEYEREETAK